MPTAEGSTPHPEPPADGAPEGRTLGAAAESGKQAYDHGEATSKKKEGEQALDKQRKEALPKPII